MTKKCFPLFEITLLRADLCSQFVRELYYAVRQRFCAAARPLRTGLPGLLPYYGAIPVRSRAVVDGNLITAAGITAGLDAALVVASLLRGGAIAQEIQLSIQYAPNPVFHSGTPETAPAEVLQAFNESYSAIAASREAEARRFAAILGIAVEARSTFLLGD
jgi:hypothetical protein